MKICTLLVTAFLCLHSSQTLAAKSKMRGCKNGKCKFKHSRLRILRDLSKTFYPGSRSVDVTLKALHDRDMQGTFGEFQNQDSLGYDIPKFGKFYVIFYVRYVLFSVCFFNVFRVFVFCMGHFVTVPSNMTLSALSATFVS